MDKSSAKIIFFGTSEFAVPALEALVKEGLPAQAGYKIVAVITTPDEPAGRKKVLTPPPIKVAAKKLNLNVWQPKNLKIENLNLIGKLVPSMSRDWKLEIGNCDLGIVAAYGKIIPKEVLDLPRFGLINIHPSLLPKYRGPTPIQSAILNGEDETGVTLIKLDEEVDHGPIIIQSSKIKIQNLSYSKLHDQLANSGAELLIKTLPDYLDGKIMPQSQDHLQATFTKKFTRDDARINWDKTAKEIDRQIRALNPEPGTWTIWNDKVMKILETKPADYPSFADFENKLGKFYVYDGRLYVFCGKSGGLEITKLQLEGGKPITAKEFINGHGKMLE